jgi:hypothetical protein
VWEFACAGAGQVARVCIAKQYAASIFVLVCSPRAAGVHETNVERRRCVCGRGTFEVCSLGGLIALSSSSAAFMLSRSFVLLGVTSIGDSVTFASQQCGLGEHHPSPFMFS